MKIIETKAVPAAIGLYSQAMVTGNLVYTSGQIPLSPESGQVAEVL
jgi:2-iminobutanoate/2-iminopropanoate deaminase